MSQSTVTYQVLTLIIIGSGFVNKAEMYDKSRRMYDLT